jgi:arsenate reductase
MTGKRRVLVLCTGNSCRSQMAEGLIDHELGSTWEAHSAGTAPAPAVHPLAIRAMAEIGIDISTAVPASLQAHLDEPWDLVITVCDSASQNCPVFPGDTERIHISFPDPAEARGSEEERMQVFRSVRDSIRERVLADLRARSR